MILFRLRRLVILLRLRERHVAFVFDAVPAPSFGLWEVLPWPRLMADDAGAVTHPSSVLPFEGTADLVSLEGVDCCRDDEGQWWFGGKSVMSAEHYSWLSPPFFLATPRLSRGDP